MTKQIYFLGLVILAFSCVPVWSYYPQSPCPEVFRYTQNMYGQVEGLLTVPYDFSRNLFLTVNASMSGFYGTNRSNMKLTLLTPGQDLLQNTPWVRYGLTFPVQESIPVITDVTVNGRLLCRGPPIPLLIPGPPITSMYATHNFYFTSPRSPGLVDPDSVPSDGNDYFYPEDAVEYP